MSATVHFSLGICASILLLSFVSPISAECQTDRVFFCYYSSWAMYRPNFGTYNISLIDPSLCTHMVYAFAGLNLDGYTFALDSFNDLPELGGAGQYYYFRQMRLENPCLKIMLSIGGWGEGSEKFSIMAEKPESRSRFIEHLLRYLTYYGFDGVDIDWEYPTERGGIAEDRENFPKLLSELKDRLRPRGKEVATAVAASPGIIEKGYDVKAIADAVDYVLLMAYDYHDPKITSHVAPLHKTTGITLAVEDSVDAWLKNCPPSKLVLGVLSSGRSYTLKSPSNNGLGADAGLGNAGNGTNIEGFLSYYEICDLFYETNGKWETVEDLTYGYAYTTKGDQWITYESPSTIKQKAQYAVEKNLAGMMLWSIDTDDFSGLCESVYPLHKAIREGLGMK